MNLTQEAELLKDIEKIAEEFLLEYAEKEKQFDLDEFICKQLKKLLPKYREKAGLVIGEALQGTYDCIKKNLKELE